MGHTTNKRKEKKRKVIVIVVENWFSSEYKKSPLKVETSTWLADSITKLVSLKRREESFSLFGPSVSQNVVVVVVVVVFYFPSTPFISYFISILSTKFELSFSLSFSRNQLRWLSFRLWLYRVRGSGSSSSSDRKTTGKGGFTLSMSLTPPLLAAKKKPALQRI